jgi:hypothetical protein
MNLIEVTQDLFETEQGYYLAHCISADFALGAGIAERFDEVYDMRKKLNKQFAYRKRRVGYALCIDNVFNLVIKDGCRDSADYETLEDALIDMKEQMLEKDITKLAIPRIASNREKLQWYLVKSDRKCF